MNSYWGGRLRQRRVPGIWRAAPASRSRAHRDARAAWLGLAIHLLTRPYESIFLAIACASVSCAPDDLRWLAKPALAAALVLLSAIGLTLAAKQAVTASWTTLPYMLSQYQYGVPASFTFQPNPVPHRDLTPQQRSNTKRSFRFASGPETCQAICRAWNTACDFIASSFLPRCLWRCRSSSSACASGDSHWGRAHARDLRAQVVNLKERIEVYTQREDRERECDPCESPLAQAYEEEWQRDVQRWEKKEPVESDAIFQAQQVGLDRLRSARAKRRLHFVLELLLAREFEIGEGVWLPGECGRHAVLNPAKHVGQRCPTSGDCFVLRE